MDIDGKMEPMTLFQKGTPFFVENSIIVSFVLHPGIDLIKAN